tara:strand:- start:156149 stop:157468 length:1320 start_codon:yes stop_codon:yes gene_type:complete
VSILSYYAFYKGLNWGVYISGIINIGGSVLGGVTFIWICTKFITFNKHKITGFEASYVDETGTGFNFPISLSKFIPDIIAAPYSIKGLSPLEAELIGFLNTYRNWPYDISGQTNKSLYQHAIEQWRAMKQIKGATDLHRAAALAQDLSLVYAYTEKRKKFPLSQFWKRDIVKYSRRCNEHGGLSATILATMPTFKNLGHDTKSNQKFRRAILTAIRYRDNPTSIPANCDPLGKDIYESLHKAYQKSLESTETNGFNPTENQIKTFNHEIYSFFQGVLKELDVNPANIRKESDGVYLGNGVLMISFTNIVQRYARLLTPTSRGNFQLWEVDAQEHPSWPYFIQAFKDIGSYRDNWENIKACKRGTFSLKANDIPFPYAIFIEIDRETFPELRQSLDTYPTWQGVIELQKTENTLILEVQRKVKEIDGMIKNVYNDSIPTV